MEGLRNKVAIYVPSNVEGIVNSELQSIYVRHVQRKFSILFGGATSIVSEGIWVDDSGNLIVEDITIVYAFVSDSDLDHAVKIAKELSNEIKTDMRQESVSLEINNQLIFI